MEVKGYKLSFYLNGKMHSMNAVGDDALECILALEMILAEAGRCCVVEVIYDKD